MREIKASDKVSGTRRWRSIEAAQRKVKDGELYLIRRHGAWFRPEGHGYTALLCVAGVFDARRARGYLDVEGLSVVPLRSMVKTMKAELAESEAATIGLRKLLELANG